MVSSNNVGAMGLVANRYKYTKDLLALEGASPAPPIEGPPLSGFLPIQSDIRILPQEGHHLGFQDRF